MIKVTAQPIETGIPLPKGSEIVRVEYALGDLRAYVRDMDSETELVVVFSDVVGLRMLDEGNLSRRSRNQTG